MALSAVSGCKKGSSNAPEPAPSQDTGAAATAPATSWYRGVLGDSETEMPFRLGLPPPSSGGAIIIDGGDGRVERRGTWSGAELVIEFEMFNTRIEARTRAGGDLEGAFTTRSPTWGDGSLKFSAKPIAGPRAPLFSSQANRPAGAVAGVYRLEFPESGEAKLVVAERDGELAGRIEFVTGNIVHLIGDPTAAGLALSGFDGTSPYLLTVSIDGESVAGEWVAGYNMAWRERFAGKRSPRFALGNMVALESRPVLDYKALGAERYESKPLVVEVGGSWCPTCKRAAVVLGDLYREHHDRGLEMLTLLYEFIDDPAYNRDKAKQFAREYAIPWEVRAMDGTIEDYWKILPDVFAKVNPASFPVTLFVDSEGRVIDFHAGFPAEADGPDYTNVVAKYRELVAKLLEPR